MTGPSTSWGFLKSVTKDSKPAPGIAVDVLHRDASAPAPGRWRRRGRVLLMSLQNSVELDGDAVGIVEDKAFCIERWLVVDTVVGDPRSVQVPFHPLE